MDVPNRCWSDEVLEKLDIDKNLLGKVYESPEVTGTVTAEAAALPWEVLAKATSRIVNEVPHVNRVLYDCTGKPPATVEFE